MLRTFLSLLLVLGTPLSAQQSATPDPAETAARKMLEAFAAQDFKAAASLVDPRELHRTRVAFEPILAHDSVNYIAQRLFRLDSTAQLLRMRDVEFNARLDEFQVGISGQRAQLAIIRGVDILGSVRRGNDTTLVIYRWRFPADSIPLRSASVQTMVRCPSGWCANMLADFSGLIKLLLEPMVPAERNPD